MYIERVPNRKSRPAVLVRSSHWDRGKVRKVTHANLSKLPDQIVDSIALLLRGGTVVGPGSPAVRIVDSRPFGHVAALLGAARQLGLSELLHTRPSRFRDLSVALVLLRLLRPDSALPTDRELGPDAEFAALNEALALGDVSERNMDETLDWLTRRQPAVEAKLARRHLRDGGPAFYTLTSVVSTDDHYPPARHGYLQDGMHGSLRILFGLLCDADGRPVSAEVRTGHDAEPATVVAQVDGLRRRLGLRRVVLVGERGTLTQAGIRENLAPYENLGWIFAVPDLSVPRLLRELQFDTGQVGDTQVEQVESAACPGERLLVCRSPRLRRNRREWREALLKAAEVALEEIRQAVGRSATPLLGDALKLRADKALRQYNLREHFRIEIKGDALTWERDPVRLAAEEALDGLFVLRTRVQPEELDNVSVVRSYENLTALEGTFRHLNYVDPELRTFWTRDPGQRRALALVCLLACLLESQLRLQLAPLLFGGEDRAAAPQSERKNAEGDTLWDFRGLLAELGTLSRHRVRFQLPGQSEHSEVLLLTEPNASQSRAFDLLRLCPSDYLPDSETIARFPKHPGTVST